MQQEYMELQGKLLIHLWTKYPGKGEDQTKKELQRASLYTESQIQQGLEIGGL